MHMHMTMIIVYYYMQFVTKSTAQSTIGIEPGLTIICLVERSGDANDDTSDVFRYSPRQFISISCMKGRRSYRHECT